MSKARATQNVHAVPSQARQTSARIDASDPIRQAQQSLGNRAVVRLMAPLRVQTKLEATTSDDALEREADQAAGYRNRSTARAVSTAPGEGVTGAGLHGERSDQPGTPVGDTLIAHELACTNPAQGGATDPPADMKRTPIHESMHALMLNRSARLRRGLEAGPDPDHAHRSA